MVAIIQLFNKKGKVDYDGYSDMIGEFNDEPGYFILKNQVSFPKCLYKNDEKCAVTGIKVIDINTNEIIGEGKLDDSIYVTYLIQPQFKAGSIRIKK